ncbi:MAG: T9SS type A sorting domain-containing protein [bacterium]
MKKLIFLTILGLIMNSVEGQFVRMPLAYPNDGYFYSPESMSIVDQNHVWVSTIKRNTAALGQSYYKAAKTSDAGNTWQFFQIPATGDQFLPDVEAQSEDVCYYFVDTPTGNSDIWKTTDGGGTWAKKTTTEFNGSWGDFIHLFGNDTLIALGDPVNGYYDIQLSNDGGDTWSRVPQSNIPPILSGEQGCGGKSFSVIGNTIWFPSYKGRCFKSIDRGLHWTVSDVNSAGGFQNGNVCFSDPLHGIFYLTSSPYNLNYSYYKTDDGGTTWNPFSILPNTSNTSNSVISRIDGIYGGFVLATCLDYSLGKSYIYYTDDFFNTMNLIDSVTHSNNKIFFKDASTGLLGGTNLPDSSIFKFGGVLTSIGSRPCETVHVKITPNPSNTTALLTFPTKFINDSKTVKVFNISGNLIADFSISPKVSNIELNASEYPDGLYIIRVISNQGTVMNARWMIMH